MVATPMPTVSSSHTFSIWVYSFKLNVISLFVHLLLVKRKRFIRKLRRTVNESRHSYQLLSRLIGSDLVELASDWLAALRDFALINLPDELAFQRPTTAGAFYDTQTGIEQVRPFYGRSWLALLEAATLCLNTDAKHFSPSSVSTYSSNDVAEKQSVIPMTRDSFFLIFGEYSSYLLTYFETVPLLQNTLTLGFCVRLKFT